MAVSNSPTKLSENLYLILGQLLNESVAGYSCARPDI